MKVTKGVLVTLIGLITGHIVFELFVRMIIHSAFQIPVVLLGTLSYLLPLGGAIAGCYYSGLSTNVHNRFIPRN